MSSRKRMKKAKKVVLDDKHLNLTSKMCQNRKCTSFAMTSVDITSDRGNHNGIPMCLHCARLLMKPKVTVPPLKPELPASAVAILAFGLHGGKTMWRLKAK